jgi:hypothetical protein
MDSNGTGILGCTAQLVGDIGFACSLASIAAAGKSSRIDKVGETHYGAGKRG